MHKYKIFTYLKYFILLGLFFFSLSAVGFSSWNLYDAFGIDSISFAEPVCYNNKTSVQYYTIEDALSNASSGDTIFTYVGKNPTIRKSCEIKAGVTLCLPFDGETWNGRQSGDDSTKWFDDGGNIFADANASRVKTYRKNSVTISKNVKLTNKGTIQIGGILGSENVNLSGHTSGNYCEFVLDSNASIVSTGNVYCLGYIKEKEYDNGSKFLVNSGTVYAPFVIYDYRGGTSTVGSYKKGGITPFNVYDMPNIKPYSKYSYKSKLIGYADLHTGATNIGGIIKFNAQHNTTDINIIGNSSSVITLNTENSYVESKSRSSSNLYTTSNDYSDYTDIIIYGGATSGVMKMEIKLPTGTTPVSTQDCFFPISYRLHICFYSGSYSFVNPMKLMNGSYIYVASDASLSIGSQFIIYPNGFVDTAYGNIAYPTLPAPNFVVDGDVRFTGAIGGFTETYNTKKDYSYIYEETSTTLVTSKEGYGDGIYSFKETNSITEAATAMVYDNGTLAETNLEQTVYVSEDHTDYFIKASNLGSYTIKYHLNGGIISNETATNDVVAKSYPIVKGVNITLNSFSINNPVKRFYDFNSWRLNSIDGEVANGINASDGTVIDVYANYSVATYSITYNLDYRDGSVMSENYTNNNILKFTKADLPISLTKPTDGNLFFYGWYYNNDTSKEITQITIDLDGVGYGDIELSGYFSTKIMSSVTFDANGHDDYFTDLASYNIVTSSPSEVVLPTSLYDEDTNTQYYLKGWTFTKDDPSTLFDPSSLENFSSENVTLYALWGNKIKVNYYFNYYGSTNNSILNTIYCYPGQKVQIRNLNGVSDNEDKKVYASDSSYYDVLGASKWQFENSSTHYEPDSIQTIDGSEGQSYNLYPLFDNAIKRYWRVNIHHSATYGDSGDGMGSVSLTILYDGIPNKYANGDTDTIYIKEGTNVSVTVSSSFNFLGARHNTTLSYPGGTSTGYKERTVNFNVSSASEIKLTN
ncbi:MAG: InlB B-repeat-containing protein [Candidatus Onthovivens sp.]|nr:InlB B-repeat-containing protein [Bacilli bacterium]